MSVFNPNIIQDESDIELEKKRQAFMESLLNAANEVNRLSKKGMGEYMVMGWPDLGKVFVRQYPNS
jgi:hypothetical protein